MKFSIRNPIENGPIERDKHPTFRERFPRAIRRSILAGALSITSLAGYSIYEKRYGGDDYTNVGTFNAAFKKARGNKEKYFYWKGKRFTTNLVDKEFSDNYWKSKKFLEDYYASDCFKSKNLSINEGKERVANLKEGTYFSMTSQKGDLEINGGPADGFYNPETNQIYIYKKGDNIDETSAAHELTHQSTKSSKLIAGSMEMYTKALDSAKNNPSFMIKHGQKGLDYLSNPTEIDARQNSARYWLFKYFSGYIANTTFTQEHYNFLRQNYEKLPYDIQQLMDLFPSEEIFISNMNKY